MNNPNSNRNPYNVLLLRCIPSIVAHPRTMYISTGLVLAGLLGGVRRLWFIEIIRTLPDRLAALPAPGLNVVSRKEADQSAQEKFH